MSGAEHAGRRPVEKAGRLSPPDISAWDVPLAIGFHAVQSSNHCPPVNGGAWLSNVAMACRKGRSEPLTGGSRGEKILVALPQLGAGSTSPSTLPPSARPHVTIQVIFSEKYGQDQHSGHWQGALLSVVYRRGTHAERKGERCRCRRDAAAEEENWGRDRADRARKHHASRRGGRRGLTSARPVPFCLCAAPARALISGGPPPASYITRRRVPVAVP